jgi:hypothetical protein
MMWVTGTVFLVLLHVTATHLFALRSFKKDKSIGVRSEGITCGKQGSIPFVALAYDMIDERGHRVTAKVYLFPYFYRTDTTLHLTIE